ncbi:hypothetical protein CFBP8129_25010 [Xanthomonas hortorum pv. gardneri]|uniref:Uncharacterized protein n=1 Tax=Xanthomonas hortorum pv. gardneri TaxID=2754056 RepID=A0A6V7DLH2_9XANT|nr:hypothetical protein NCPPB940_19240 [Xanthomonas hortorum pv. taraxaci]CAD0326229.1 hypothetical protein NCPPB940_19240 [Xanthomonas hortorum pv. taraxaci]CAD0336518.1 hypothetical protein CFBP8129_25010 [Xanthomonas hortorum pv. gardneri]CAD0336527.1 hypothetical protein CFBP8129_25010 [Xanthomonas hortorum pv. gardneri]CAH2708191.1 hypothetical protein NCPPB1935_10530 [Xanthomonas campestris pv. nigromaculans]
MLVAGKLQPRHNHLKSLQRCVCRHRDGLPQRDHLALATTNVTARKRLPETDCRQWPNFTLRNGMTGPEML